MATAKRSRSAGRGSRGFLKFCLGFLLAVVLVFVGGWAYLWEAAGRYGGCGVSV